MKKKALYVLAFIAATVGTGCKKDFLEELKVYDKYDESVFTNDVQTGWYVDRMYNYCFASYKSPTQAFVGLYNDEKTRQTEEIGGTVGNWINPNKTLQTGTDADAYYGSTLTGSAQNTPYTRIRYANFLLEKIDGVGQALPESFRKTSKGQMYFLRGLQYFDLVRMYGGVPLELKVNNASSEDQSIRTPRATATEVFEQIVKDFDSAAVNLPATWPATDYGRFTSAAALAMKSRVLLTAASPLFNTDWDNSGSARWQAALDAGLAAETALTAAGYGLYGTTAKDWSEMTFKVDNGFNKEAIMVQLLSSTQTTSVGANNSWENGIRPKDHNGSGNGVTAPKGMLDLFPLADGRRPTVANGYVDTFFFENRDPRFYRTFAFSGAKWGTKTNANKVSWFYRWKASAGASASTYSGNNQTSSPAVVRKMSNPAADTTLLAFSGTDIFEYRYAELLLNIAECYAAKGDVANAIAYIGKVRNRVGIPAANNWGLGTLSGKYAAIEACLYERRVELAYEGKRFFDVQRWLLYDGNSTTNPSANTCAKLGITPINGTNRTGYYWQALTYGAADPLTAADKAILIDPDAANFTTEIAKLKSLYKTKFVMTALDNAMDRDGSTPVNILFRPNYYVSGLTSTILSYNPWLGQSLGWMDYSGAAGSFNPTN
ncbi:MAG TPA: RagB/SusD family nutrient uptake outer membrane protein [Phnomibacter sp.]|nr:RagB/SusD family nutrient uptake outer membrane protein [Phnomibacter sp.]